ncbi:MAG: GreA/GreB family elongation factor [Anaerolineaceae bacterium]|nr:GreA/GreB family elongation factor [Anaerolineaceae bacterium]
MSEERVVLTREGYESLKRELEELLTEGSAEVNELLVDANDDTGSGEEPTFFDAVVAKERLNERIAYLKTVLARAEIIEEDEDPTRVTTGNRVTVWDMAEKEELVFDLLSTHEIAHGRRGVSLDSPVGKALVGHQVGDVVEITVPDGVVRYQIRKIEQAY